MFEDEKRRLEEATIHCEKIKSAILDKTVLQAIKYLAVIVTVAELGLLGITFYLTNSSVHILTTTLAMFVLGDALLVKQFHAQSNEYQEKYQELENLSLEELRFEEQVSEKRVSNLRRELEFEMSASTKEKEARNMQQKSQTILEDYIIEKGNASNKEKHMVKCLGIKRS